MELPDANFNVVIDKAPMFKNDFVDSDRYILLFGISQGCSFLKKKHIYQNIRPEEKGQQR